MDRKQWLTYYEALPSPVQDYLLSETASTNEALAQEKLGFENDIWDRVMDIVWDTVLIQLSKQDFRERVKRIAGDRKPEDVERVLLFSIILPLADLVSWDVETRLQELGVPLPDIQGVPRVTLRPVSYGAASRRIAYQAKLSIFNEEMARRLRDVLVSYIKGVRGIDQVKEIVQRKQQENGLGFTPEQAETYVTTMKTFLETTQVLSEEDYAQWLSRFEREAEARRASQAAGPATSSLSDVDDQELLSKPVVVTRGSTILDQIVEQLLLQVKRTDLDAYLTKRLSNLISTRLREVRNGAQAKAMLARDARVGGMGFDAVETERVAQIIEAGYEAHRSEIEADERQKIQAVVVEQKEKMEERKKRESEEHAKWFKEKVQGVTLEQVMQGATPLSPAAAKPMAPPAASVATTTATIDGIRPPARLMGLAEELTSMTVSSFRRLAKTPDQAAEKILQKLETLRQDSFEHWTEGVEAWRSSPIEQLYLSLVAQSFTAQKPVADLAEERHAQDPDMLTAEEVGVLVSLNARIQF